DPATGKQLRRPDRLADGDQLAGIRSLTFSPDGKLVAAGTGFGIEKPDLPGVVGVWDVATGKARHVLRRHRGSVTWAAFNPDGKVLASAGLDATIRLWDTATGKERLEIKVPDVPDPAPAVLARHLGLRKGGVCCVAFCGSGKLLASAHQDGTVRLWDPATGKVLHILRGHGREVAGGAPSPPPHGLASPALAPPPPPL